MLGSISCANTSTLLSCAVRCLATLVVACTELCRHLPTWPMSGEWAAGEADGDGLGLAASLAPAGACAQHETTGGVGWGGDRQAGRRRGRGGVRKRRYVPARVCARHEQLWLRSTDVPANSNVELLLGTGLPSMSAVSSKMAWHFCGPAKVNTGTISIPAAGAVAKYSQ